MRSYNMHMGEPMASRLLKIALLVSVAIFLTVSALDNVTTPGAGYRVIKSVVSMEAAQQNPGAMWRAVASPAVVAFMFGLTVLAEALAACLCWLGAARLWGARRAGAAAFQRAKRYGLLGCGLSALLYHMAFLTIGGEWFRLWHSATTARLDQHAFYAFAASLLVMMFLNTQDGDAAE